MKKISLLLIGSIWIYMGCESPKSIQIENASENDLEKKNITLSRGELGLADGFLILKDENDQFIPVQHDDLDGDGVWDVVAFQCSVPAKAVRSLRYEMTSEEANLPKFERKTNAYLGYSKDRNGQFVSVNSNDRPADHEPQSLPYLYQFEGPAWESELVAFRSYFDRRNGKDIFGKTVPQLKAESIGLDDDYHTLDPEWGMDILKVGNSLGAGALAMYKNDSVIRLGVTEKASFRVISEGPVRSILELSYDGWIVNGTSYSVKEQITIWAGKRSYESKVSLQGGTGVDTLATGIVNLKELPSFEASVNGFKVSYTHGLQSENHDALGMALTVPDQNLARFDTAPISGAGVTNTYLALLVPDDGIYRFQFFAGWELENKDFSDRLFFEEAVIREANASSDVDNVNISIHP